MIVTCFQVYLKFKSYFKRNQLMKLCISNSEVHTLADHYFPFYLPIQHLLSRHRTAIVVGRELQLRQRLYGFLLSYLLAN